MEYIPTVSKTDLLLYKSTLPTSGPLRDHATEAGNETHVNATIHLVPDVRRRSLFQSLHSKRLAHPHGRQI